MDNYYVKTEDNGLYNKHYITNESRLKTFEQWPKDKRPSASQLAACGFYFTGSGDKVACYYCGVQIIHWRINDNPWIEHALHSPKCAFVRLHRSTSAVYNWNSPDCPPESKSLLENCVVS